MVSTLLLHSSTLLAASSVVSSLSLQICSALRHARVPTLNLYLSSSERELSALNDRDRVLADAILQ